MSSTTAGKARRVTHLMEGGAPQIQKGIPIPPIELKKNGTDEKWPVSQLEVGDSFFAKGVLNPGMFYTRAKKLKIKITLRKIGKTGVRVWRVK